MYKRFFKRIIDIIISTLAMPFLFVICIIVFITIKMDDGGPLFYKSQRLGKNFRVFHMYKFRSMKVNSPNILNEDGSTFNAADDERVTRVGKFMRETSIDELPQIFNVFKGEMSLIGPRPGDVESIDTYEEDEKGKMLVVPGISGYTQAYYRNNLTVREKRLKDAWYAKNISFILDTKIFFKTIRTVLKKENIYTN